MQGNAPRDTESSTILRFMTRVCSTFAPRLGAVSTLGVNAFFMCIERHGGV